MAYLNHWIPACACLLQAGRNDGGAGFRFVLAVLGILGCLFLTRLYYLGRLFQTCLRQAGAALPRLG